MFCQQPKQTTLDCEFMDGKQWRATLILIAAKGYTCRDTPRARKISWLEAVNYYCAECRIRKVFLDLRSSEWPVQDCRYYRAGRETAASAAARISSRFRVRCPAANGSSLFLRSAPSRKAVGCGLGLVAMRESAGLTSWWA
jgi:hypothetical protein